jgi:hypothetical protein
MTTIVDQDPTSSTIGVDRSLVWANAQRDSLEYFTLVKKSGTYVMEGTIVMVQDRVPTKIFYQIGCDDHWSTRFLHLRQERNGEET